MRTATVVQGATSHYRPWTMPEETAVRTRYVVDGPAVLAAELGRSLSSVHHRARRLGSLRKRRWSAKDNEILRMLWGEETVAAIAKRLGRTVATTYQHAKEIGLPLGCPQGREYLTTAGARTGYRADQLRRILTWAGVRMLPAMSRPWSTGPVRHYHTVDPFDVDEAVARWHKTETLEAASRRLGWCAETIHRDLVALGEPLPAKPRNKRHWRIPSELIDRATAHRFTSIARTAGARGGE